VYRRTDLGGTRPGRAVTILAEVVHAKNHRYQPRGRRRPSVRTSVVVTDRRAELSLTFFGQGWRLKHLEPGTIGMFAGEVRAFHGGLELVHPDMDLLSADTPSSQSRLARGILPIYPATRSVSSWQIEDCVAVCLDALGALDDPLDATILQREELPGINDAFEYRSEEHTSELQSRFDLVCRLL